jgi:hypothetical protein
MGTLGIVALVAASIPSYIVIGWVIFGSWSGFLEALWVSLFCGHEPWVTEGWEDAWWLTVKFFFFLLAVAAFTYAEYQLLAYLFGL